MHFNNVNVASIVEHLKHGEAHNLPFRDRANPGACKERLRYDIAVALEALAAFTVLYLQPLEDFHEVSRVRVFDSERHGASFVT